MTTKCVIYRRYSSDEQGKGQGETLATQLEACKDYARRKGWEVTNVLTDEGFSAYKGEHLQPGAELHDFVEQVHAGRVDSGTILLAFKQNRVSRLDVDETMVWIYGLTSRGIGIAFADQDRVFAANPSMEDYLGVAIRAAQAHQESKNKSDLGRAARTRMWAKAERREGKWTNLVGRPPLWLKRNDACDDWIIDQHRAGLIMEIYAWAADGLGVMKIVQRLNARNEKPWGIWRKNPNDATWQRSSVRELLVNPAVEGDYVPERGMFDGRQITGFYPRIVKADVVAKARAGTKARQKHKGRRASTGSSNLFAGLTVCGECGRRAFMTSHKKKGRTYRYLRCEAAGDGRKCSNTDYFPYDAFEAAALEMCVDLALDDRFFEVSGELRELRIREAELEKLISEHRAQRQRMMRKFDDDDADANAVIDDLKRQIDGYAAQLADVKTGIEKSSGKVGAVEHLRRVNDIRLAATSDDQDVREQARSKLRVAFASIINRVSTDRGEDGGKVITMSFLMGVLGVQIDTKGNVVGTVSEALGQPLWNFLTPEKRAVAAPLIQRLPTEGNPIRGHVVGQERS